MTPLLLYRVRAFVVVGVLGFLVQIATFAVLTVLAAWRLEAATAASVLAAVLHNFAWHARWTWRDRRGARALRRLVNFTIATGSSSVVSNVASVSILAGSCHIDPLIATTIAVVATSVVNYLLCDRYVFA